MSIPELNWLTIAIQVGSVGTISAILIGVHRTLNNAEWAATERRRATTSLAALLIGWYVAATLAARVELFGGSRVGASGVPTIQYGILIPFALGLLLLWRWPLLGRVVAAIPQSYLAGIQFFRIEGLVFLLLYAQGLLPGVFALPSGYGDITVGLLAPLAGMAASRGWRGGRGWLTAWNLLGLADLLTALTTGILSSPSRLQRLAFGLPNVLISTYPLAMIPVFLVPLALLLHVASLRKLWTGQA